MRRLLLLAGVLVWAALLLGAQAAGLTGTWTGSFDFQGTSMPLTLHLNTAGGALTGTLEGLPPTEAEIQEGKVDGGTVSFWVNTDYQGTTYRLNFEGKVSAAGDAIAFTFGTEDGSWSTQFTAAKATKPAPAVTPAAAPATVPAAGPVPAPVDLTGIWKGSFDLEGASTPLTLRMMVNDNRVTGTVEGLESPAVILDGMVEDGTVSFGVNTDYQGTTYKLNFEGKVSAAGDAIAFTFGTEDGSWSTTMTVKRPPAAAAPNPPQ